MKKMRKLALFLVLLLVCGLCPVTARADNQAVLDARTGILQVNVGVKEKGASSTTNPITIAGGSGFLIGTAESGQYVLTNWHVVNQETQIEAYAKASNINVKNLNTVIQIVALKDVPIDAQVVKFSEDLDLAILKLEDNIYDSTPLTLSSKENIQETQAVYALGFPDVIQWNKDAKNYKNEDVNVESGTISQFKTENGVEYIIHSAKLSAGNSGGPLVDVNGYVVGMNCYSTRKTDETTTYYSSTMIDEIRSVLDTLGIQYEKAGEASVPVDSGDTTEAPEAVATEAPASVDKTSLNAAITEASALEQSDYTEASYSALDKALANAQSVSSDSAATAEQVSAALSELQTAQTALEKKSGFPVIAVVIVAIAIIAIIVVVVVVSGSKKKKKTPVQNSQYNVPNGQGAAPVAQPPVQPAPARPTPPVTPPPFVGDGAGETSVLNEGAGETTLLSNQNIPQASLFRLSNRENIRINKGNFSIGKERRKVDYCISNNNSISRNHAEIVLKNGVFYVVDQKSTNGTYLNDVKLNPLQEMQLKNGDKIRLSDEEFEFKAF